MSDLRRLASTHFSLLRPGSQLGFRQDTADVVAAAPLRAARAKRTSGRLSGCDRVSYQPRGGALPGGVHTASCPSVCSSPGLCAPPRCQSPAPPSLPPPPPAPASGAARTDRPVPPGPVRHHRCRTSTRTTKDSVRQRRPDGSFKQEILSSLFLASVHLSRGPSPISLSTQEAWPVAAAITEYISAYFKGGQHNRSAPVGKKSQNNSKNHSFSLT